ncbi:hypothetical protein JRO89_XS04G0053800 [Xanthoceras sorbifolium]|uniref:Amine oxidase domain-containing protein n=1 Tax=Xanthoceras sorbifolium TaxID=99658 RepID=A0ABQ8I4A8_9ROSI|nr:hypothetical protein JRO89_XS04G0053800 [Xanthoceras sorbifolium]
MRVAVVGAGISGLVAAHVLAKSGVEVVLYEKKDHLGGHAMTITFDGLDLNLAFIDFNNPLGYQQWNTTLGWFSHNYVNKLFNANKNPQVKEQLESWGCQIRIGCQVYSVSSADGGFTVVSKDGSQEMYSGCIMAVHAPDALKMLGSQATFDEKRVLGAFQYANISDIFLHRDKKFMPQDRAVWSACNFVGNTDGKAYMTYWLNALQNIGETSLPFLVTPEHTLVKWSTALPLPSAAASKASVELHTIQS